MPVQRLSVDEWVDGPTRHLDALIDARSPAEYTLDHLPGADNWPSLDDEERRIVGTEYRQISPFEARKRGAAMVCRNIARHLEREAAPLDRTWRPLVYCWRGGQRSGSLALVLGQIGFDVHVLEGGYRAFRQRVLKDLESLDRPLDWRVLCGRTGSGKTRLLQALARAGEQVLDLEALACHRGSVLGALPDQPQPSQKRFETQVWQALRGFDPTRPVWVESESRMIGRLRVPEALLQHMRAARCVRVVMPVEARVRLLLQDYPHYAADPARLALQLQTLREARGADTVARWQQGLAQGAVQDVVSQLLEEHYDPTYLRSMQRNYRQFDQAVEIALASGDDADLADVVRALGAGSTQPVEAISTP
jgi:tRNA 2-selenouridine synthase